MVVSRKEKPSFIPSNLRFLRNNTGETMDQMAKFLGLKGKSSYNAYEDGKALPDIHKLMKLATHFEVSLEDLVYKNISVSKLTQDSAEVQSYEVEFIPAVAAGYTKGFGDPTWVNGLEKIKVPYKPYGIARAFQINGDSMEPEIKDKSIVLGIKIGRGELKDNKTYVVVTEDGPVCKNVMKSKKDGTIYLISKNERYHPIHLQAKEILELWEVWKKDIYK
jgi:phage repressor protein C with HTH and peptisase S24 domain